MSVQTSFMGRVGVSLLAVIAWSSCRDFKPKQKQADGGLDGPASEAGSMNTGGRGFATGGKGGGEPAPTGSGGGSGGASNGGSGEAGAAGGGAGGAAPPILDCIPGSARLCKDDPDLGALGNCGEGTEMCVAGHWGPCSVRAAAKDTCALLGDDASCNGRPNEGCPCVDGSTQVCGPPVAAGICVRGTQTCAGGAWGACMGAVYAAARDCTSAADNNCDGSSDNTIDAVCVCASATTRPCDEHAGKDGTGRCKAGRQTCVIAADKKTSAWGACSGAVAPAAADTCDPGNDDNCSGVPNEGCSCVAGASQACGPVADVGICKRGTQSCAAGTWGTCTGMVVATARDCTSALDNNCDGMPDRTIDAVCACAMGATRACDEHVGKDGVGRCRAGSQTCVVASDKRTSAWGACTGAVGPAAADTCDLTNDDNCNGTPHDSCTCTNGASRSCGPAAIGICRPGTQVCAAGTWPTACPGQVIARARNCTSTADNDCNGIPDNSDSTCVCAAGTTSVCPGTNHPQCISGMRTCVLSADMSSTSWSSTCTVLTGNSCGTPSCATDGSGNTTFRAAGTCNSSAACPTPTGAPCAGGRACASATACATTCSGGTGCANGYTCSGTTCIRSCPSQSSNNVVSNAGFDVAPAWTGGDTAWSTENVDATCGTSRSLSILGGLDQGPASPCFPVMPSMHYFFGYSVKVSAANFPFECGVLLFDNPTCAFPRPNGGGTSPLGVTPPAGVWMAYRTDFTALGTSLSGLVSCGVGPALLDNVYVNRVSASF